MGPAIIRWLKIRQTNGQPIRSDGPPGHVRKKTGTPTMGGILILLSFGISTLLWADLSSGFIWTALLVTLGFGVVGFIDDYLKVTRNNHKGVSAYTKILL